MTLIASEFFNLESYSHLNLWQNDEPVWAALLRLEEYLQGFHFVIQTKIPSSVYLDRADQISIGQGVILEPNVYIQGPCIIGNDCVIRHGAYLRGQVVCGSHCVIGHGTELKRAVLLDQIHVAHLGYVGDSIVGNRVNLGAGVKCANLRLDRSLVSIRVEDRKINTGLKKFGCVIGDGSQIGCNSVLSPGTLVGPECAAYPLTHLHGVIPGHSWIKSKNVELDVSPLEIAPLKWQR